MNKVLTLNYLLNGRVYNENRVYNFETENKATVIVITVPHDYQHYTFVMDCNNGDVNKQIELGSGDITYMLTLDNTLTSGDKLKLQLWATMLDPNTSEVKKTQWEVYVLPINNSLKLYEQTVESNPDIIATHSSQICELYKLQEDTDETVSTLQIDIGMIKKLLGM